MADPHPSDESLIKLAGILVTEQSLDKTLRQILDLACATLSGGDDGGITLLEREGPRTAVATSEAALRVDSFQYDSEEGGPCLEAYRQQQVFRIESTADDQRWPGFCQSAAAAGIKSTLSLPLVVGGDGIGALNIYCRRASGFSPADEVMGASFASYASVALVNARVYWRTQRLATQLEEALSTRGVIEQAKGIIITRQGCSADQAFQLLVEISQRSHIKLHDVARDLVARARDQATAARQDPGQPSQLRCQLALRVPASQLQHPAHLRARRAQDGPPPRRQQPRHTGYHGSGPAIHEAHRSQVDDQHIRLLLRYLRQPPGKRVPHREVQLAVQPDHGGPISDVHIDRQRRPTWLLQHDSPPVPEA